MGDSWFVGYGWVFGSDMKGKAVSEINHPQHYGGDTPYECIKVLEAWGLDDFCLGNVVKYISRAGKKEPDLLKDLLKAQWYLNRKIENLKKVGLPNTKDGLPERRTGNDEVRKASDYI